MPIYEYACTVCKHKTDILHGINEVGPHFCPECGAEGTMRKGFAPPAIGYCPTIARRRLVLPTPLRPRTQVTLPGSAFSEMPRSAWAARQ